MVHGRRSQGGETHHIADRIHMREGSLKVVKVDAERDLVLVSGSVPGANGALVTIKQEAR